MLGDLLLGSSRRVCGAGEARLELVRDVGPRENFR